MLLSLTFRRYQCCSLVLTRNVHSSSQSTRAVSTLPDPPRKGRKAYSPHKPIQSNQKSLKQTSQEKPQPTKLQSLQSQTTTNPKILLYERIQKTAKETQQQLQVPSPSSTKPLNLKLPSSPAITSSSSITNSPPSPLRVSPPQSPPSPPSPTSTAAQPPSPGKIKLGTQWPTMPYSMIIRSSHGRKLTGVHSILSRQGLPSTIDPQFTNYTQMLTLSFTCLKDLLLAKSRVIALGLKVAITEATIPRLYTLNEEEYESYPLAQPSTRIEYVCDENGVNKMCEELEEEGRIESGNCILGLDCEWTPTRFRGEHNPIAVIQISSSKTSAVFHIWKIKCLPHSLGKLLASPNITFIISGRNDVHHIYRDYSIKINYVDLQSLPIAFRLSGRGLGTMVGLFMKERVSKEETKTDWERDLTPAQIRYAALDAELTRRLYFKVKDLPIDR